MKLPPEDFIEEIIQDYKEEYFLGRLDGKLSKCNIPVTYNYYQTISYKTGLQDSLINQERGKNHESMAS